MTLHPIAVVDQVLDEYRNHVLTEFRARDNDLRQALEEAIDRPGFLAQEPFLQAHRPFRSGDRWRDLPLDPKLAQVMEVRARKHGSPTPENAFLHQSQAIAELLSTDPRPVVVTTGTGSGKTECFLLPVIENAVRDSVRFRHSGLTAILIYPMNALANDQEQRIRDYLEASGHTHVGVARYDRSTPEKVRNALRDRPPHILLTNYAMLEYLLVRPADVPLFANHRCRYLVLDEVHSYRGSLGSNIALLFRRLLAHLRGAPQTWRADDRSDPQRFPRPVPVATSATIKSVDEAGRSPEEVRRLRDEAVQEFLGKLTGCGPFRVIGEEIQPLQMPAEARWPASPAAPPYPDPRDPESVRRTLVALAGLGPDAELGQACRSAAILWRLGEILARKPLSIAGIVEVIREQVPERQGARPEEIRRDVEAALVAGAALADDVPGALRLRAHRFIRGGWRFHRCVDPSCGKLYPMGEERCTCGKDTAPLYLCRSCGADTLRFRAKDPHAQILEPNDSRDSTDEWLLYDVKRLGDGAGELPAPAAKMRQRPVLRGSFDPATRSFAGDERVYPLRTVLAPARNRCLVCGAQAGPGSILTPVGLGTSAAVRVIAESAAEALAEQHEGLPQYDGKERLLIFADSRQDAAHQARFISYAGRYDRMRRRLVQVLREKGAPLTFDNTIDELLVRGVDRRDNPHTARFRDVDFLNETVKRKARAWEEAPFLDDLAVSAGYRATALNLGLVGLRYGKLGKFVDQYGRELAASLGLEPFQLVHLCRCLLDEVRRRKAFSRPLLQFHPDNPNYPGHFRDADWERRVKTPNGYACLEGGEPVGHLDADTVPRGIQLNNFWGLKGRRPSVQQRFSRLLERMGGGEASEAKLHAVLRFLCDGPAYLQPVKLYGYRKARTLLQVNADCVLLELLAPGDRRRCSICNVRMPWAEPGLPCPACSGILEPWPEEKNRYAERILKTNRLALEAGEHTAQISGQARIDLEAAFKAPPEESPVNVLSCSPTLELGVDVGGLDAVVMRNVPPRPDNYAQRGGRAGRRSRVGVVLGYARSTPHDGYFYDKPAEMIAGEVPAPGLALGNRDVIQRHLNAIAFAGADPGLAGRMIQYIDIKGNLETEAVDELIAAIERRTPAAAHFALAAWGAEILEPAGLASEAALRAELDRLPERLREMFQRVRRQILGLQETIDRFTDLGKGERAVVHAMRLKRKLLGVRDENDPRDEADDHNAGHPMRRLAEFGILPGYEFPSEPATVRLLNDEHEEHTISVERRFGIAQYQPEALAHARGHRWRVIGLDTSSPWNPSSEQPDWIYVRCAGCGLRYGAQEHGACPRCGSSETTGATLPGYEFGGFLARRDDRPVLEEEDRFSISALVQYHPQRDGRRMARYRLPTGWTAELNREETVRWVNEWKPPSEAEIRRGSPVLHDEARGFYLCPSCGAILKFPDLEKENKKGRPKARRGGDSDPYNHRSDCPWRGQPPQPLALVAKSSASTLRITVPLPADLHPEEYQRWGLSLGFSLRTGMRQLYTLDGPELELELEPMWQTKTQAGPKRLAGALTFIDPAVGGSGFLERAVAELHLVAHQALEHLEHPDCETACYRCLKSYHNQRVHEYLSWPRVVPDLLQLAAEPPEPMPTDASDDPAPWLAAYDAGVGSPLELKFLRLFERHGLAVTKQLEITPAAGETPITVADFAIPDRRIAIYVDGAAFHRGQRLRRDQHIRARLAESGWKVIELKAKDLARGNEIVMEIQRA